MKKWALSGLMAAILTLTACASDVDPITGAFKGKTAEQLFDGGEQALAKKNYKDSIKHFEALAALYPFSGYEQQAQLDLIYAYYMAQEFESTAAAADRFIHLYPRSEFTDYAYYMKGVAAFNADRGVATKLINLDLSERDLSSTKAAFNDFTQLVELYPNSKYAAAAQGRMIYLRNLLANHEVEVSEFYMHRKTYIAAINRANYVVKHYQQAPAVIPALAVLVKAYRELGLNEQAEQSLAILKLNYPDSKEYKALSTAPKR